MSTSVLATVRGPIRLLTDAPLPGEEGRQFWLALAVFGTLAVISTLTALWFWWRRSLVTRPSDHAFRAIARRLGLRRRERELLCRLARAANASPLGLIMSPGGLQRAIDACKADPACDKDQFERLAQRLQNAS